MDLLQIVCYLTAAVVPAVAFYSAYRCRRNMALTVAARLPDPAIAALLCSVAGVIFGYAQEDSEAIIINSYGCAVYLYSIAIFISLSTLEEFLYALKRLEFVCYFVAVLVGTRQLSGPRLCVGTATGWAAASATLLTFLLSANKTVEMLPHWGSSSISMIHGSAWCLRGVKNQDYYGASTSGLCAFCSFVLLALVFSWPGPRPQRTPASTQQVSGQSEREPFLPR